MSIQACRDRLKDVAREQGGNAGLMLASYLRLQKCAAESEGGNSDTDERLALFTAARQSSNNAKGLYLEAFKRREKSLDNPCSTSDTLKVKGRLIIGLGGENVLETGITLHHTYGTPLIPGSALKGLAAHYCDQVWGESNKEFKRKGGNYHHTLFGNDEVCGYITFHDAWIMPETLGKTNEGLVMDVMTPHHADYYSENDHTPPADFDDPTPLPFLTIAGDFRISLSVDDDSDDGKPWLDLAMNLLKAALENWGVGGKTNAGYGRMYSTKPSGLRLEATEQRWVKAKLTWSAGDRILSAANPSNNLTASIKLPQGDNSIFEKLDDAIKNKLLKKRAPIEGTVLVKNDGISYKIVSIV